ncbi:hypothetical protein BDB01DRAFT_867042 [Pilobolus umbonatus]|nr:hypothetical protein BDB01DRAFT_867042 [Pilobolus umbonatus]
MGNQPVNFVLLFEVKRYVIHEYSVKEIQAQLEAKGESSRLDKPVPSDHHRRLRPFSRNHHHANADGNTVNSRLMRAAILYACPDLDLSSFKELSAESTIISGLEKDLLKYDEIHIPKHYKFGLLTIQNDQTTEESWFSNTGLSDNLQDFINIMGTKVELKGYSGYAAGLDTKTGESGDYAYVSKWKDSDIMFHVASIMPSRANDKQQVSRKKHIGNDIVCIIFIEGNEVFNPKAIRSQFLHVYIVVRPEMVDEKRQWRVEVIRHKNVRLFGPALPCPPLFHNDSDLKEYLMLKCKQNTIVRQHRLMFTYFY